MPFSLSIRLLEPPRRPFGPTPRRIVVAGAEAIPKVSSSTKRVTADNTANKSNRVAAARNTLYRSLRCIGYVRRFNLCIDAAAIAVYYPVLSLSLPLSLRVNCERTVKRRLRGAFNVV